MRTQPGNTDSFIYDDSWGVKSLLLDDDGCYCNSALEAGKITCFGSDPSADNTWQDSANGERSCHRLRYRYCSCTCIVSGVV